MKLLVDIDRINTILWNKTIEEVVATIQDNMNADTISCKVS